MQHLIWWVGGGLFNEEIRLLVSSVLEYLSRFQNGASGDSFEVCWPTHHITILAYFTKNIDMETQSTDFLNIPQIIRIFNGYVTLAVFVGQLSRAVKFLI